MPKEVSDIKQFIEICRRKDASCKCPRSTEQYLWLGGPGSERTREVQEKKDANALSIAARIKRNRKTQQIKFKVRCHRFLYTLVLKDSDKADKLKQSLPPSTLYKDNCTHGQS